MWTRYGIKHLFRSDSFFFFLGREGRRAVYVGGVKMFYSKMALHSFQLEFVYIPESGVKRQTNREIKFRNYRSSARIYIWHGETCIYTLSYIAHSKRMKLQTPTASHCFKTSGAPSAEHTHSAVYNIVVNNIYTYAYNIAVNNIYLYVA